MKNRYDLYSNSIVKDIDGEDWPDPLSIDYDKFEITNPAVYTKITFSGRKRFWLFVYNYYKTSDFFDIILSLNNIEFTEDITEITGVFLPDYDDLLNFVNNQGN